MSRLPKILFSLYRKAGIMKPILISFLILCLFISFASCAQNTQKSTDSFTSEIEVSSTAAEETDSLEARKSLNDDLAEKDFEGELFRMIYQTRYAQYQFAEELNGDILNDAVYNRNSKVESRFNVKIVHSEGAENELASYIVNTVLAGSDEYDLYMGHALYTGSYIGKGVFADWYNTVIDFAKPWFPQYAVENLTLNNRMFLTVSDICLSVASNTYCMFFNKMIADSYNLPDIYALVREGSWTLDKLSVLVTGLYSDINGDGAANEDDFYGLVSEKTNSLPPYLFSCDIQTVNITEDGTVEMLYGNEKSINMIDKLRILLFDNDGSYSKSVDYEPMELMFSSGQAIFIGDTLGVSATSFRETCDFDYGIIPYPKYDEEQKNYYTVPGGSFSVIALPMTVVNYDLINTCVTALSAESWKDVLSAYYDVVLKYKGARDEESIEMLDIILNGRNISFEFVYDAWTGYIYKTGTIVGSNQGLASFTAKNNNAVLTHFEKIRDVFFNP